LYILYFAIWGILSLKLSPIDHTDPGLRTIVPWHPWLDNRDGFGPLMVIGLVYSFYYYQAAESRRLKLLSLISLIFCTAGIVLSFGRAVFVAMAITIVFMWYQSKKKIYGMFLLIAAAILIFFTISLISPDNRYWETMQTINNGLSEGTGADRSVLWGWAWREFINYPIFGVGTGNFGIALVKLVPLDEALRHGYTEGRLWGRALHSAPFTILSEYGLVGTIAVVFLIIDFINTNRKNRNFSHALLKGEVSKTNENRHPQARVFYYISLALMACFLSFWINGFFYEIIYTSFLWNLIVINRLLYINMLAFKNPEIKLAHSY
jgi:O-antigen ligase